MTKYLVLLPLSFIIFSCQQKNTVEGHIVGLGTDTLLVESLTIKDIYEVGDRYSYDYDTIFVKNDRFYYNNKDNKPKILDISGRSAIKRRDGRDYYPISMKIFLQILPNDKIKIKGNVAENAIDYMVIGSPISNEYNLKIRKKILEYLITDVENYHKRDSLQFFKGDTIEINELSATSKKNWEFYKKINHDFIQANLDNQLTGVFIIL